MCFSLRAVYVLEVAPRLRVLDRLPTPCSQQRLAQWRAAARDGSAKRK